MTVRIDRKNSSTTTPTAKTESKPAAGVSSFAQSSVKSVASAFTGIAQQATEKLQPKGHNVAWSASPKSLWGGVEKAGDFASDFFTSTNVQQNERIAGLKNECCEVHDAICDRVEVLEKKWRYQKLDKKAAMLKNFADRNDLSPADKTKIQANVAKADELQKQVMQMAAELKASYPPADAAAEEARHQKLRELVSLRREQRALVSEAKDLVATKEEQNVALLAQNEQQLNPNAAPNQESLLSMMGRWMHLTSMIEFFVSWMVEKDRKSAEEAQKEADQIAIDRQQRDLASLRKADFALMQRGLKVG